MANYQDLLQDPAYPDDYPASVAFVRRRLYAGRALIEGYLYLGQFYQDAAHTNLIPATSERMYVDVPSGTAFRWNGSAYVTVSVSSATDLAAVHYTADSVSAEQKAQARANIGAADATSAAAMLVDVTRLVSKEASWDAKQAALSYDAQPTTGSSNLVRSGGIFTWVNSLLSSLSVAWTNVTGKPTTLSGFGITDGVKQVKVGESSPVSPDVNGIVRLPAYSDPNAVRFDQAQGLTDQQKNQARENIGARSATITSKAQLVVDGWSSHMKDSEKTALLERLVRYVAEKEGISI